MLKKDEKILQNNKQFASRWAPNGVMGEGYATRIHKQCAFPRRVINERRLLSHSNPHAGVEDLRLFISFSVGSSRWWRALKTPAAHRQIPKQAGCDTFSASNWTRRPEFASAGCGIRTPTPWTPFSSLRERKGELISAPLISLCKAWIRRTSLRNPGHFN